MLVIAFILTPPLEACAGSFLIGDVAVIRVAVYVNVDDEVKTT